MRGSTLLRGRPDRAAPSAIRVCALCGHFTALLGLRDYGIEEQIGLESTMPQFLHRLVAIFAEVRRVLTDDGTLWLNIGDGYTSGNRGYRAPDKKNPAGDGRST